MKPLTRTDAEEAIRQVLLDLLTQYQELEKPTNPDLLKMFIEASEDKLLDLLDRYCEGAEQAVQKLRSEMTFPNSHDVAIAELVFTKVANRLAALKPKSENDV